MVKWSRISEVSAYKRADAHLVRKTAHGAIVTILGVILGITLAAHEISWYATGKGTSKMAVDLARRHDLDIRVDISFPAIPCAGLSVDVMDASGTAGNDASRAKGVHLHKVRLDSHGKRIGGKDGEYNTPQSQKLVQDKSGTVMQIDLGAAMSQMSDMDSEIQRHEGCRVHGDISVRRVAGRLHFAVHQQSFIDVLPQMLTGHVLPTLTNMSHIIHKVAFGPEFPGQVNPLDGFMRINGPGEVPKAYKYFLKIVPTQFYTRMGVVLETSQYSVGEFAMPLQAPHPTPTPQGKTQKDGNANQLAQPTGADAGGAGASRPTSTVQNAFVDFSYDLSPIVMTINSKPGSLLHFIVRLCAVVGGVLSVTRMADKLVHALLVSTGVVVMKQSSTKGLHRGSSGSYSSGYSSARNSMPGDAAAYVSGSPLASAYSGSFPVRSSSGGDSLLPGMHLRERAVGSFPGTHTGGPGSHPLSRFNSSGAGSVSHGGAPGSVGGTGTNDLHTAASGGPGSFGGTAYGGPYSSGSAGASGLYVGDAIPRAASGSMGGGPSSGGALPASGLAPTASGQVTQLLHMGSGSFAPPNALAGPMQRGSSGGFGSSGGASAAPNGYVQQQGTSRLGLQHSLGR